MENDDVIELLSPEGLRLLDTIPPYESGADVLRISSRLRREGHPPSLIASALTQARLRERAQAKFGEFANRMLFTRAGLEQATRLPVAALHAGRFAGAGVPGVVDLGCGIGGDAMAMGALDLTVDAVERDHVTAAVAAYNLAPFPTVAVRVGDAESADLADGWAAFLDPARRVADGNGGRRVGSADWSPSLDFCFQVAAERSTGIKLAPGLDRELIPDGVEAQWVTAAGETVELVVWSRELARPGVRRSAAVVTSDGLAELTAPADSDDAEVAPLGRYVYEPAGSVIRARLIGDLARRHSLGMLSEGIAYLSGDEEVRSPFLAGFEIVAELPLDQRAISRELRARGIGRLEVKKRGVDIDPATFRKRLELRGENAATLLLSRADGHRIALLANRLQHRSG